MPDAAPPESRPSVTNALSRRLAALCVITGCLMAIASGHPAYQPDTAVLLAVFGAGVGALGWPTWRNVRERAAGGP